MNVNLGLIYVYNFKGLRFIYVIPPNSRALAVFIPKNYTMDHSTDSQYATYIYVK